jgi:hypothetical protein
MASMMMKSAENALAALDLHCDVPQGDGDRDDIEFAGSRLILPRQAQTLPPTHASIPCPPNLKCPYQGRRLPDRIRALAEETVSCKSRFRDMFRIAC